MQDLLAGKNFVIMGVANERSLAYAIAQSLHQAGGRLVVTYQNEKLERRVRKLCSQLDNTFMIQCDVTKEEEIDGLFRQLQAELGTVHGLVHSLAYAKGEDLQGSFMETSREGYQVAQDISVYSLIAVAKRLVPLMTEGGSIMTMTYLGAERAIENYNVMGVAKAALEATVRYLAQELGRQKIRVNGISAGPISTLAAMGVANFDKIQEQVVARSMLGRSIEASEVGDTALFLASHLSRGITGEVIHVDGGYHAVG